MGSTFNLARHVHGMASNPDQIRHGGVCHRAAWRQAMIDLWKYIKYLKSIAFNYFKNNSVHQHPFRPGSQIHNLSVHSSAGGPTINMKSFISLMPLLAHSAAAGVIQARASASADSNAAAVTAAAAATTGNPFSGYQLYANSYYSSEVYASAIPSMTGAAQAAASSAAVVPSFFWL